MRTSRKEKRESYKRVENEWRKSKTAAVNQSKTLLDTENSNLIYKYNK